MYCPRIVARLDIKTSNVVKGIRFDGLRVLGKPDEFAEKYYVQGADELLYIDTVASLYGRNNLTDVVKQAASHTFIPMTVGGGIRSVEDAQKLFRSGADKIAVNTAAIARPELLTELAHEFGSQAVVASIQIKRRDGDWWECFVDCGREVTGRNALEWVAEVQDRGAGELLITSVDNDGTGQGYDTEFFKVASELIRVPVIAAGGVGEPGHVADLLKEYQADAVAMATMLHYDRGSIPDVRQTLEAIGIRTARH